MAKVTTAQLEKFEQSAYNIRDLTTRVIALGKWGHIGGSYSLAEILSVLYTGFANIGKDNLESDLRDCIVLSKAHCSPALYAALAEVNILSQENVLKYCDINSNVEGHLDQVHTPGIEMTGGSLGIGLSYCAGIAKALKMKQQYSPRVFCIVGDGELSEGEIWEGIMFAAQNRLDNLITIVDYNKVQAKGFLYEEINQEPLAEKFKSFGWNVIEADGHDVEEIYLALYKAKYITVNGKPTCIIAHTVKGRGVTECEFNYRWHTHAPSIDKANEFLKEMSEKHGREFKPITENARKTYSYKNVIEGDS